jgi:hypothetical protein
MHPIYMGLRGLPDHLLGPDTMSIVGVIPVGMNTVHHRQNIDSNTPRCHTDNVDADELPAALKKSMVTWRRRRCAHAIAALVCAVHARTKKGTFNKSPRNPPPIAPTCINNGLTYTGVPFMVDGTVHRLHPFTAAVSLHISI